MVFLTLFPMEYQTSSYLKLLVKYHCLSVMEYWPSPLVYWTPYLSYFEPMVFWPPPTHGVLTPYPWNIKASLVLNSYSSTTIMEWWYIEPPTVTSLEIRGFNIPWIKIYLRVNIPWGSITVWVSSVHLFLRTLSSGGTCSHLAFPINIKNKCFVGPSYNRTSI